MLKAEVKSNPYTSTLGIPCSVFSGFLLKRAEVGTGPEFQSHGPGDIPAKFITGLDPITIGHIL
jgi:hypothetical protein